MPGDTPPPTARLEELAEWASKRARFNDDHALKDMASDEARKQIADQYRELATALRALIAARELAAEHYYDFDDEHRDLVRKLSAILGPPT